MRRGGRSRSRSRGRTRWGPALLTALTVGALVAGLVIAPSAAFTTGSVDRGTTVTVADDTDGFLGIDVADSVRAGSEGRLVTVTNNLDRPLSVSVSAAAALSNDQATLAPGESLSTTVTVSCESPPSQLQLTVTASASGQFSAVATRSPLVVASGCQDAILGLGSVEVVDRSTTAKGAKAEYTVNYSLEGGTGLFENVTVELKNIGRQNRVETKSSSARNDTLEFTTGGPRFGDSFEITIRLFNDTGEVVSELIVVTDTADGSGTVYRDP
ncbi:hypothetical protein PM032_14085 [Halorubrum ezzemoulense]|uniref:hypothetical protein n=1 Tax=Halorubrum ezzemoulense TaxID=337243 RepID=UPI0023304034|nr:hypothetical protein [Halorubrum ezzemoulense]MDB2272139.1 hypothetical protein [Halorubrum ezzemoulense]MDB2276341.1 hypothetical protein [Halorubrum ezzemoulense]MDB2283249.1 hypothetical protein [Halorubrum ezzemoulense]